MNLLSVNDIKLNMFEYCFTMGSNNIGASEINVFIPKLMPLVRRNEEVTTIVYQEVFNSQIFINARENMPTVNRQVTLKNHISIPKFNDLNRNMANINGIIPQGRRCICCIMNDNTEDIYLTDNI